MAGELILIVEDNEQNRKLVRDVLRFKGYQTIEVETGEDSIHLARERHPKLVLMDIQLPGINGIEIDSHDGDSPRRFRGRSNRVRRGGYDHIAPERDQFPCEMREHILFAAVDANLKRQIAALDVSGLVERQGEGRDVLEALRRLRADPVTQPIPVMAMTASTMTAGQREMLAAGFDGYQSKPLQVTEFLAAVEQLLEKPT